MAMRRRWRRIKNTKSSDPPPSLIYSRGSGSRDQVTPRVTLPLLIIRIKKTTVIVAKRKEKIMVL